MVNNDNYHQVIDNANILLDYFRKVNNTINKFHKLWQVQYITSLREKHFRSAGEITAPRVGELVFVKNDSNPQKYPLGRVEELVIGKDNKVREVLVMIEGEILRKAVNTLIPLEVSNVNDSYDEVVIDNSSDEPPADLTKRPKRRAAQQCETDRLALIQRGDL